jgi:hypothetical protein
MPDIVFYVSGHGFGHAVRASEVLRALRRAAPRVSLEVRTAAPRWIFPPDVQVRERGVDVGVVQRDSLHVEPRVTLARCAELMRSEPEMLAGEVAELRAGAVRLVAADIPSAAFAIARRVGVPGVGIANFCWDWIYEPYVEGAPEYAPILARLRSQYGQADLLLRLPFHGDLSCFAHIVDVPLIARRGSADRAATRRRLGLPADAPLVLLSFGGFAFAGVDDDRLEQLGEYAFVTVGRAAGRAGPRNVFTLQQDGYAYQDLVAACDVVVGKLGYGLVAECLANRVPLLYVARDDFREDAILGEAVERAGRALRLSRAELGRGDLRPALQRLLALDMPWADIRPDGAELVARRLLESGGL